MAKISVIIPTFNRPVLLRRAIQSVIDQTYKDWELIVIDNGKNPQTRAVVEEMGSGSFLIRYESERKIGVSATRNKGIRMTQGEYVAFLDDDDVWFPEKLEDQIRVMKQRPELAFVSSAMKVIDEAGVVGARKPVLIPSVTDFRSLLENNYLVVSNVLVKRAILDEIGFFDEELLVGCEDYDLWLRIAECYSFAMLENVGGLYQVHANQMSQNIENIYRNKIAVYSKVLARTKSPDVIKEIKSLLAKDYYKLGTECKDKSNYVKAKESYRAAIKYNRLVGLEFYLKENPQKRGVFCGVVATVKPFVAYAMCSLKAGRNGH